MLYLQVTSGLFIVFKRENNRLETKQKISNCTRLIVKITKNEEFDLDQQQLSNSWSWTSVTLYAKLRTAKLRKFSANQVKHVVQ